MRDRVRGCGSVLLSDLDGTAAERWLAERRQLPKKGGGISAQTSNHYATALKAFGNWFVKARRVAENPLRYLSRVNADVDIRHVRRALSAEEFIRLLQATHAGNSYRGISGPDSAALYLVAGMTGLRASELASLAPLSFALDADTPTVTVEAAYSKHRRRDEVPLHPDLVIELRQWLTGKQDDALLWPGKWAKQNSAAAMIRGDLEVARRVWIGEGEPIERPNREGMSFWRTGTTRVRSPISTPFGTRSSPIW